MHMLDIQNKLEDGFVTYSLGYSLFNSLTGEHFPHRSSEYKIKFKMTANFQ